MKVLNQEQREAVLALTDPEQVPIKERRRQYNAIHRLMGSSKSLPTGLAEKWAAAKSSRDKLLGFNVFLVHHSIHSPFAKRRGLNF